MINFNPSMKVISIVIPVFRNAKTLEEVHSGLSGLFTEGLKGFSLELIFVDDGSDDDSFKVLQSIFKKDERVKVLSFSRNFGQVPAIIGGLDEATGDAVIIMSADLQDPVEIILQMVDAWDQGNEVVIAHRKNRKDSFATRAASGLFYQLMKFSKLEIPEGGFDFVLLDRKAHHGLKEIGSRNRFLQGDILWLGFETKLIPYERQARETGKSQWSFGKKLKYLIDGVLSTSYWPIRLMSLLGFITAFSGFVYILGIVYMRLVHATPFNGWAPIMVIILFVGGMIMMMLGIIGEYLWRIYDEVRDRPYYILREKLKHRDQPNS